jgi:Transketolase, pyrimidine binding domain
MKAMREVWGDTLVALGKANPNVVVLDADLANSTKADKFAKAYPDRFLQMGIAGLCCSDDSRRATPPADDRCVGAGELPPGCEFVGNASLPGLQLNSESVAHTSINLIAR